jgi:hypothetical protein
MSLPLAFFTTLETIPSPGAYLQNDPDRLSTWQKRLGTKIRQSIVLNWIGAPVNEVLC